MEQNLATRGERLLAFVIDGVFIWIISFLLLVLMFRVFGMEVDEKTAESLDRNFGKAIALFFYFPGFTLLWGATPGKKILKMKVVSKGGENLPWYRIIFREMFLRWISVVVLGHLWIFFNKRKKNAWDYGAGSVVVKV